MTMGQHFWYMNSFRVLNNPTEIDKRRLQCEKVAHPGHDPASSEVTAIATVG